LVGSFEEKENWSIFFYIQMYILSPRNYVPRYFHLSKDSLFP
jgi:hypothetical protein